MVFTYQKGGRIDYLTASDENETFDGEEVEIEVSTHDIIIALADIIYDIYFMENINGKGKIKTAIKEFITDNDLYDTLEDNYYDELKEYFEGETR